MEPYVRFTSQDYDPDKAKNKFMHLTNACINEENQNQAKSNKQQGRHIIRHNMWETHQMQDYLNDMMN